MKRFLFILFSFFLIKKSVAQYSADSVVNNFVKEWIGKPYKFGGKTIKGIDCSALVQTFYKVAFGYLIPRTCYYQFIHRQAVELENIKIGDVLYFKSKLSPSGWHCGIFIGDNQFFHAANWREGVKISCLTDGSYMTNLRGIGRFNN